MLQHWRRSRVTKAITDSGYAQSFSEAEARLDAIDLQIVVGQDQIGTPAGQAAVLTAVVTARKCFGRVAVVAGNDAPLNASLPLGKTLLTAARRLGSKATIPAPSVATHVIRIGRTPKSSGWDLRCWWDRWLAGTRAVDDDLIGDSRLALAGVFAGAVAVRQVFACVLAGRVILPRDVSISLWTPWESASAAGLGPERFDVPDKIWLIGLGHLGQAFVWNLCQLPGATERLAVLQDDQLISEENEATSLLVRPGAIDMRKRKTRLAAPWLETAGWRTQLIERRHLGDIALTGDDPPYLLTGLDRLAPRLALAKHGFPFMLDAGIGHGAGTFEGIQIRTIANGKLRRGLWAEEDAGEEAASKRILNYAAYAELEKHIGQCGTLGFAEASGAVPFVGAAAGALTIAQVARIASLETMPLLLQMELGSPEMTTLGGVTPASETNLGSFSVTL
jgi:hypothetical protein